MNLFEKILLFPALWIGFIPIVGVILGWFNFIYAVPVLGISFLGATIILLVFRGKKSPERQDIVSVPHLLIVIGVAVIVLACNWYPMFKIQPWLEDDDPYGYAVVADYISHEHTFKRDKAIRIETYAEPDSQGFNILISVFHQLTGRMNQTLKWIVALLLGYMLIVFFFFAREFFKDDGSAMFSTIILATLPAFLTRFIFATPFAVFLFILCLYGLYKSLDNKNWSYPTIIFIASLLLTHHLTALIFGLFLFIVFLFEFRLRVLLIGIFGAALSLGLYWVPELLKYTIRGFMQHLGIGHQAAYYIVGTADKPYRFVDFWVPDVTKINAGVGLGPAVICLLPLVLLVLIYYKTYLEKRNQTLLMWSVMTMVGIMGFYFPVRFMPFRWWPYLAICVALLIGRLYRVIPFRAIALTLICGLVIYTSFVPKLTLNWANWAPSFAMQRAEGFTEGYLWMMHTLPPGTPVFSFASGNKHQGFNLFFCEWCPEDLALQKQFGNLTLDELHASLIKRGYKYLTINQWTANDFGVNQTMKLIRELSDSERFKLIFQLERMYVYELQQSQR